MYRHIREEAASQGGGMDQIDRDELRGRSMDKVAVSWGVYS
jgi:hypothetical protein